MACSYSLIRFRVSPSITDPKVLQTLITHSLRSLYGEFNRHEIEVLQFTPVSGCGGTNNGNDGTDSSNSCEATLKTKTTSVGYVSAALTMTSMPPLIVGKDFICIDIIAVEQTQLE